MKVSKPLDYTYAHSGIWIPIPASEKSKFSPDLSSNFSQKSKFSPGFWSILSPQKSKNRRRYRGASRGL
ncbi:hypothetical protein BDZ89DRAFT_1064546, partial [Hymenopellis radicata]